MKKILLAIILVIALVSIACQSTPLAAKVQVKDTRTDPEQIKNSTLLFVVESIHETGVALGYGMGTVVQYQGGLFVVTHNHWGNILEDTNIVEIRDANNRMLQPIFTSKFKSLIVYQDAGTMVLRLPDGLSDKLTPASLYRETQLKPGEAVQVAHRRQPDRDRVEILDAVVVDISLSKDTTVYTLRSLDSQYLQPGDSGGGVWHNGQLVANTWTIITESTVVDADGNVDPARETLTDRSHAAIFPEGFK